MTKTIFSEKNVTFLAGSIAYNAFVSLVPLILFFFLAVSIVGIPNCSNGSSRSPPTVSPHRSAGSLK